jgi:L-2,4-diaminobutyrate decarboxylase
MMSVKVYTLLRQYGTALFEEYVDYTYSLAQDFAGILKEEADMELALNPETNVVCFRYKPRGEKSGATLSKLNSQIRKKLLEDGEFYIVQTQLKEDIWLRTTLMNPFTTVKELKALLERIKQLGGQLQSGSN